PQLDFMVGTRNIKDLPDVITDVYKRRKQVAKIQRDGISIEYTDKIKRRGRFHAWLPVMTGCDKECTFCIVPKTRGSEVSMPAREVCREATRLVGEGVKWITLLGQNVNSYRGEQSQDGKVAPVPGAVNFNVIARSPTCGGTTKPASPAGGQSPIDGIASVASFPRNGSQTSFPQLLEMLCQIEGLERISFTTSHPQDATAELFQVIARNPKISRRFHLPLQSGSDRMLKRMKRMHTYEEFKQKIDLLRKLVPEISLTTDMIAGFSGESADDHLANVRALEEIRFDSAFLYKYSVRPGTPASKLVDDVPIPIKEKRLAELLKIQDRITTEENRRWLGRTVEVFVEGHSPKKRCEVLGRSHEEKKVVCPGEALLLGTFQKVKIIALRHQTFVGELCRPSACAGECGNGIHSKI
ncbi:MAG: radical SAM protein, partial [Candidatus Omnitrophica bacterium]|nr:radical SAM protein [Candidatus Omnitrophota bacterium]